ncbi:MAG: hypothetical protein RSF34_14365 [Flavobacterium sp.]|uniref:hypothetical protein n=1 Tax=Flavobacterium sp. TaxID=239 RepID=UPI002FC9775A
MKNTLLTTAFFVGVLSAYSQSQVGIGTRTPNASSQLEIVSNDKGVLFPRVSLTSTTDNTTITQGNVNSLFVYNSNTLNDVTPGYYYWLNNKWLRFVSKEEVKAESGVEINDDKVKLGGNLKRATTIIQDGNAFTIATGGSNLNITGLNKTKVQATDATNGITDRLLAVGSDDKVKALKAAMPKFFYMPSIIVPTSLDQLNAIGSGKITGDTFDNNLGVGSISLYGRYNAQFGTTGTATQPSSPSAPLLPVLPANQLHYYVTWYDVNVFSSVSVNSSGVMSYTLKPNADITVGSFMNIVFAVKED